MGSMDLAMGGDLEMCFESIVEGLLESRNATRV
jgi:hypothetical protein